MRTDYVAIDNAFARVDGVLRRGAAADSRTVVVQTHPRWDSYTSAAAWPMADLVAHGFDTFACTNRYTNSAAGVDVSTLWEPLALDLAAAVQAMRERGYERVVLLGTSAGGPLVAFYQAVAERGNAVFEPERTLSGFRGFDLPLPPADALLLQSATAGPALSFCIRLDGAVVDEADAARDPSLDLFAPANGFDPERGTGRYEPDFLRRYERAQAERMNRLIDSAQARLARIAETGRPFVDDDFVVIPGVRAYPAFVDLGIAHESSAPHELQPGDRHEVIRSSRPVIATAARDNRGRASGATVHTLTSFLSYRAIRTDPERYDPSAVTPERFGVDMRSTNTSTTSSLEQVSVPLLITQGTADIEAYVPAAEMNFNAAASADKRLVFIEHADHRMLGPRTRETHLDVVTGWLGSR